MVKYHFTYQDLQDLASELMFQLSEEQCLMLESDFKVILEQMEIVEKIDTKDIKPMDYLFSSNQDYLRDDHEQATISWSKVCKNAPHTTNNFIQINRVINYDSEL